MDGLSRQLCFQDFTILIVPGTLVSLGNLFDFLASHGFKIVEAREGGSALEKARDQRPDLVLLDALTPGVDAFELCRCLRTDEVTRVIPVILLTLWENTEHRVKGFAAGAADYVTQPIQPAELLARLVTHLRLRDLARQLHCIQQQLLLETNARKQAEKELNQYRGRPNGLAKQAAALPAVAAPSRNAASAAVADNRLARLSCREIEVLRLVVEGLSSAEIAKLLTLSPDTVKTYRKRIMHKLDVEDLPALVKCAILHGLTTLE